MILTLLLSLAPALGQEPAPESASPPQRSAGAWRFDRNEQGSWRLFHGDDLVLAELAMERNQTPIPFRLQRIAFHADEKGDLHLRLVHGQVVRLHARFALDDRPRTLQLAPQSAIHQLAIGFVSTLLCDTLWVPERGAGLQLPPDSLDLDFWEEGGPAAIDVRLTEDTVLRWVEIPADRGGADAVQHWLREQFRPAAASEDPRPVLPAAVEEAFLTDFGDALRRRALSLGDPNTHPPQVIDLQLADLPGQVGYDLLFFHNADAMAKDVALDLRNDLGWNQPQRPRLVVDQMSGDCLGEIRGQLQTRVPAHGFRLLVVRPTFPRGVVATSAGPLAPRRTPWMWDSLQGSASGAANFAETFVSRPHEGAGEWMIFTVGDRQTTPLRVRSIKDQQGQERPFEQQGTWIRLQPAAVAENSQWSLEFRYQGHVEG